MSQIQRVFVQLRAMPMAGMLLLGAALLALASVFIAQFVFGLQPCVLCVWQRIPYAVVAVLALAALGLRPYGNHTRLLLTMISFVFAISAVLAVFHSGVELHWWLGTEGCSVKPLNNNLMSPTDLREQLLGTEVARCDVISWSLLGLSMANWNVLASAALAGFAGFAAHNHPRKL